MPSKHPVRNVHGEHRRATIKILEKVGGGYSRARHDVFRDFVELSAIAIANRIPRSKEEYDRREARYLNVIGRYSDEDAKAFAQALGEVALATETEGGDVLGDVYMGSNLGNDRTGQFFTPFDVSTMMAKITAVEAAREIVGKGRVMRISEPCIGAGSIAIATFEELRKAEIPIEEHVHLTAIDIDERCCHMAFIQLSLRNIPAMVIRGNALSLEEREYWFTPAHMLFGWDEKLRVHATYDDPAQQRAQRTGQLPLFDLPEAS